MNNTFNFKTPSLVVIKKADQANESSYYHNYRPANVIYFNVVFCLAVLRGLVLLGLFGEMR